MKLFAENDNHTSHFDTVELRKNLSVHLTETKLSVHYDVERVQQQRRAQVELICKRYKEELTPKVRRNLVYEQLLSNY